MLSKLRTRLRALVRKSEMERELDDELRHHIEQQTEQNIRLGMNPEEAQYAARKAFGGVEQAKERSRDARGVRWLEDLWQDLRFGARMLLKSPRFVLIAICTLSLGIGGTTAVFSLVNAVFLTDLPYWRPQQLVDVWGSDSRRDGARLGVSITDILNVREWNEVFSGIAAMRVDGDVSLTGNALAERVMGGEVTSNYFHVLGVAPVIGRDFFPEEGRTGADGVILITRFAWERLFNQDRTVIGRQIRLNGQPTQIIGVLPAEFRLGDLQVFKPLPLDKYRGDRKFRAFQAMARMKPGITIQQAQAAVQAIGAQLEAQYPDTNANYGIRLYPVQSGVSSRQREPLLLIFGAAILLLLASCVNVTNLLLIRAIGRRHEYVIRASIGAGPWRIAKQSLAETLLLFLCGGLLGLFLALWFKDAVTALAVPYFGSTFQLSLDWRALTFSLTVSALTGLVFGLVPALRAARVNLAEAPKEASRSTTGSRRASTVSALIVAEVSLAFILLVSTGLLIKGIYRLSSVPPGFNPDRVVATSTSLSQSAYSNPQSRALFARQALDRVRSLSGVEAAGVTSDLPLDGADDMQFTIDSRPALPPGKEPTTRYMSVSPGYFAALKIPIVRGRDFLESETEFSAPVIVISETMARRFFPSEEPLGKRLRLEASPTILREIVGVVADMRQRSLGHEFWPILYRPIAQANQRGLGLVVRAEQSTQRAFMDRLRAALTDLDPNLVWSPVKTMNTLLTEDEILKQRRFVMLLLGIFAILAFLLSVIGIYGTVSYAVSQQTREFAIRLALGAPTSRILATAAGRAIRLTAIGLTFGLTGAVLSSRLLKSFLFNVGTVDAMTYLAAAVLFLAAALLASYLPARRALKVNPAVALRCE